MSAGDMTQTPRKRKRTVISCTECHRRKQKCDRQRPCLNCKKRGLQDRCHYVPINEVADTGNIAGTKLISDDGDLSGSALPGAVTLPSPGTATASPSSAISGSQTLARLGYANDDIGTRAILKFVGGQSIVDAPESRLIDSIAPQYKALIRQLPPKTYVEKLVRFFFAKIAWQYDVVDEAAFGEQLSAWGNVPNLSRSQPHNLDPEVRYFPALLFQVLAQALLFQPARHETYLDDMKHAPDMRLADLAADFSDAGQQILSLFEAGDSALVKVQAGLQRACFLKTAGQVVEAWHVLGRTVKDAQELGLHHFGATSDPGFPETSADGRHLGAHLRIWLVLHLWDAHMSVVLGRPMATKLDPGTVPFPSYYVGDHDHSGQADQITPLDLILCGYHIAYKHLQEIHQLDPMKPGASDTVQRIQDAISTDLSHMSTWARYKCPMQDNQHPWLPAARENLITEVNFTSLALHRPYIFAHPPSRVKTLHAALQVLQSQRRLFDATEPSDYPAFNLVFATFDAVVIVAVIYILFPGENIAHLHQSLQAVEWALERLDAMKGRNAPAASAFVTLTEVYRRFQVCTSGVSFPVTLAQGSSTSSLSDAVEQTLFNQPTDTGHELEPMQPFPLECDSMPSPPSPLRDLIFQDLPTPGRTMHPDGGATNIDEAVSTTGYDFWTFFNETGA